MNGTLVDSNSDEEIVLDITGFHDEEVLDKQSLTGCDHSESHLLEESNDAFTLNGRIKGKFVSKNVLNFLRGLISSKAAVCRFGESGQLCRCFSSILLILLFIVGTAVLGGITLSGCLVILSTFILILHERKVFWRAIFVGEFLII